MWNKLFKLEPFMMTYPWYKLSKLDLFIHTQTNPKQSFDITINTLSKSSKWLWSFSNVFIISFICKYHQTNQDIVLDNYKIFKHYIDWLQCQSISSHCRNRMMIHCCPLVFKSQLLIMLFPAWLFSCYPNSDLNHEISCTHIITKQTSHFTMTPSLTQNI